MSLESTRNVLMRWLEAEHSDVSMLADDVVFTMMTSGEETVGPQAVLQMMTYFYHAAFDATAVAKNVIAGDGVAVLEADFVGKHVGEFAGVPATGKKVHVPFVVIYDIEDDEIKRARMYFEMPAMMQQLRAPADLVVA